VADRLATGTAEVLSMKANPEGLHELVRAKIEHLRPKLLDLSRRNPLVSTKLSPRSNAHIRAVDELPDILFFKINNEQQMNLLPLPPIEEDPRDERTDAFRESLINARITDEAYLAAMEAVDRDADDYLEKTRAIERALKDTVRAQLGLAPRVQKSEINLTQHAKNNGIIPSYELPGPEEQNRDGRHADDNIQTLLLPSDLERKLNAIISKSRTWVQETGLSVMQVAFGFLEWSDEFQTDSAFAPLILMQVRLNRTRTPQGAKYSIVGTGDDAELNAVLVEKLRIDFAMELPKFDGSSLEAYFADVARCLPKKKNWRVRRQVAIGVFPSARLAMYHDLDPKQSGFPKSEIVQSLLAGSDATGVSPYADEYQVDEPEVEAKVPYLVTDADSSQFSALADIGDGKNLAIEGPPGTGKSQTIVNAIAAALGEGKKVLFVAEKLAALNVVKARLEAVGLGEFLLPLQAEKSAREQVMESIRARLDVRDTRSARDYDEKLTEFRRVRTQLADYINLITTEFGASGLNVHAILGRSIATNHRLSIITNETLERCNLNSAMLTTSGIHLLLQLGSQIEKAHAGTLIAEKHWKDTRLLHPDRFVVEESCALAKLASEQALALDQARGALEVWGIDKGEPGKILEELERALNESSGHIQRHPKKLLTDVLTEGRASAFATFLDRCATITATTRQLADQISGEADETTLLKIREIESICARASLSTIDRSKLAELLGRKKKSANDARAVSAALEPLITACESAKTWQLDDLAVAHTLYREVGREAIALRSDKLSEVNAAQHLRKLCEEGLQLRRERDALSERISFTADVSLDALVQCVSVLRTAGLFGIFSSSCRNAKRLFKSISRSRSYAKDEAISCLDDLIAFRRKSGLFLTHAEATGLFGIHYRGMDTKFEPFARVAKYYGGLFEHFNKPGHAGLREFMLRAPVSQLNLLPPLPRIAAQVTFASVRERITSAETDVRLLEIAIDDLRALAGVFKSADIVPSEIEAVRRRLEKLLLARTELDHHEAARELLGDEFAGHLTDVSAYEMVVTWAQSQAMPQLTRAVLLRGDPLDARECITKALLAEGKLTTTLDRLANTGKIDVRLFTRGRTLIDAAAALEGAAIDSDGLFAFATFASALEDVAAHGIMPLVEERLQAGSLSGVGAQLEALAIRQLAKAVYAQLGKKLTRYRGTKLDELRASLAEKDKEIIRLSRRQLRAKVKAAARPPIGNGIGKKSTWTDMALIENEISKKQRFIPVRELTQRAGKALVELKPCWMMSPLAVAQYVPKGSVKFDLCIIDEASQMPPESAIGALLRCDQAVVVGDTNQLPPSSFFKTMIDDEDADEDEAVLNESVLEMANGAFRPARRLRWHYRSRHSGLIKFSNRLVYDDNLIVFPSATEAISRMGVEFKSVKGRYKAGTNPIEAKTIIEAIIQFMRTDPERSLGIVTLNQKQRDLIMEEFEYAITNNRAVQKYIDTWKENNEGLEEFFIKNLENVQGDERDVIFIGTVYGPEELGGRVMQRFGPINGLAGKRRLNVLFTRAKQKIVTFSSMSAADIEAEEHTNPGAYMLKRWLEYAASGVLDSGEETENEPDSDFEVYVIDQIRAMGCKPVPQVGVAGYFVDIGIRHPEWPYGFILGVECDGATYHSAKSARDRDRLRQEVLENLGWKLHRIWSTDWFNNPRQEAERLRKVIGERLSLLKLREHEYGQAPNQPMTHVVIKNEPALAADIFEPVSPMHSASPQLLTGGKAERRVEVGDTVRVRYLTDDKRIIKITISKNQSDPSHGIIHHQTPVAFALLGAEAGDEVEILVGSYIRPAIVEDISKSNGG
jgi:very-short-patch-repair endonuclease